MRGEILIVDDEQGMCEVLAEGLGKRGFRVAWETTGETALARLGQTDFVVVTETCAASTASTCASASWPTGRSCP
jgi:CheY-like chemotaxis protein